MNKTLILILLLAVMSCDKSITKLEFEKSAQEIIDDNMLAGFSVAVFDKDSIYYSKGFGKSRIKNEIKYKKDTRQIVASISKTIIAISIMKAQELGLINLDDDINKHLPFKIINPYFPDEIITIRQLTNHTSSIKYSELISGDYAFSKPELSLREFCENYLSQEGEWYKNENFHQTKPGLQYDYSNIAATLVAYIIENESGISYREFTEKYIFSPMNLKSTNWFIKSQDGNNTAELYELNFSEGRFDNVESKPIGIYPVRDLTTNIYDLCKIGQMVLNNGTFRNKEILSEASVKEMLSSNLAKKTKGVEYIGQGVFWVIDKNQLGVSSKVIGHSGGDEGIFTMFWINQKTKVGYLLLSNTGKSEHNVGALIYLWRSLNNYGKSIKKTDDYNG